jgi:archaellum component FlaF (FlaF/FlaG flagellin family)
VAPSIQITGPTNSPTYTNLTSLLTISGTATDNVGVAQVTLRNSRDVAGYIAAGTTTNWTFTDLPLFKGTNLITAIAYDASGNSATDTVLVTYNGAIGDDDVLRSGNIVQEIVFPDNLPPGETVTVHWKVLSYVPIQSRVCAGVPARTQACRTVCGISARTWRSSIRSSANSLCRKNPATATSGLTSRRWTATSS